MVEISASLLNIKQEDSIKTMYNLETSGIEYFHIDVMDGKFVEKDTSEIMLEYCEYLNSITNLPLDVHLMVDDVKSYVSSYSVFEPNIITFHLEAAKDKDEIHKYIKYIKDNNAKVGISIKPDTKVEDVYEFLPYIHLVLIMTVEPGKGGQGLLPETLNKILRLREYIDKNNLDTYIEADGGINLETVESVKQVGTDIIVVGTALANSKDYKETIDKLRK